MKKTVLMSMLLITIFSLMIFAGCNANNQLNQFDKALNITNDTISSLDNIESNDLSEGLLSTIASTQPLSFDANMAQTSAETIFEKISLAIELQNELRLKQAKVNENKLLFLSARADIKANIQNFKNLDLTLTDQEKEQIKIYIEEIKTINKEIKNTIGNVYKKIFDLRGKYRINNIDTIIKAYSDVQPYMDIRVEKSNRIIEIINDVNQILVNKVNNED